jgi:hypothetical protein
VASVPVGWRARWPPRRRPPGTTARDAPLHRPTVHEVGTPRLAGAPERRCVSPQSHALSVHYLRLGPPCLDRTDFQGCVRRSLPRAAGSRAGWPPGERPPGVAAPDAAGSASQPTRVVRPGLLWLHSTCTALHHSLGVRQPPRATNNSTGCLVLEGCEAKQTTRVGSRAWWPP